MHKKDLSSVWISKVGSWFGFASISEQGCGITEDSTSFVKMCSFLKKKSESDRLT